VAVDGQDGVPDGRVSELAGFPTEAGPRLEYVVGDGDGAGLRGPVDVSVVELRPPSAAVGGGVLAVGDALADPRGGDLGFGVDGRRRGRGGFGDDGAGVDVHVVLHDVPWETV